MKRGLQIPTIRVTTTTEYHVDERVLGILAESRDPRAFGQGLRTLLEGSSASRAEAPCCAPEAPSLAPEVVPEDSPDLPQPLLAPIDPATLGRQIGREIDAIIEQVI